MGLGAVGAAGLAISAASAVGGGIAQGNAAGYQAQVAKNNAQIAQQNAQVAIAAGETQAQTQSLKGAAQVGQIKATQAAGGIDVNTGSAVKVRASQAQVNQLDTLTTMRNAAMQAYGYQQQATSDTAQSSLLASEAEQAPIGGAAGAAGNLLSGASGVGFKFGGGGGGGGGDVSNPLAATGGGVSVLGG